jgi:predicted nucleotidyltransferase
VRRKAFENLKGELTRRYVEAMGPNLVALAFFGSWARGEEKEWSDIDLLLIAKELPDDPFERRWLVREPVLDLNSPPMLHPCISTLPLMPSPYMTPKAS